MPEVVDVKGLSDDEFVKKYEKLVHHFVWKNYGRTIESIKGNTGLDIDDITQCGMMGLIKARRDFNPEYGCKFSTYAIPKIHGEISKSIMNAQKVKVPREIYYLKGKIMRQGLSDDKLEDISEQLGVSAEEVEEALQYQQMTSSLNGVAFSSGSGDDDLTLEQMLVDENATSKTENVADKMLVDSFVQTLQDKEMIVLDMHLTGTRQEKIGNRIGKSQVQVSRILKRINERAAAFGKSQGVAK